MMEDFYVQRECCTACGVPQVIAPDLVGWSDEAYPHCIWVKQPQTADELDRAIKIVHAQELGCHRYSGSDPAILERLPPEECDHLHPLKPPAYFSSSGPAPNFSLSVSAEGGFLRRLWRKFRS
jgi:hypothetical protein